MMVSRARGFAERRLRLHAGPEASHKGLRAGLRREAIETCTPRGPSGSPSLRAGLRREAIETRKSSRSDRRNTCARGFAERRLRPERNRPVPARPCARGFAERRFRLPGAVRARGHAPCARGFAERRLRPSIILTEPSPFLRAGLRREAIETPIPAPPTSAGSLRAGLRREAIETLRRCSRRSRPTCARGFAERRLRLGEESVDHRHAPCARGFAERRLRQVKGVENTFAAPARGASPRGD